MSLPSLSLSEVESEAAHEHDNRQPGVIIFAGIAIAICYITIGLRLLARRIHATKLGWSDFTIILALAFVTVLAGLAIYAVKLGLGLHVVFVGVNKAFEVAKMLYLIEVFQSPLAFLIRLSILIELRHVFGRVGIRWFNMAFGSLILLWLLDTLATTFLFIFQCFPIEYSWTTDHQRGCLDLELISLGTSIAAIAANVATMLLPLALIRTVKLSPEGKVAVASLLALTTCGVAMGCVRVAKYKLIDPTRADFTWLQAAAPLIFVLEAMVEIICACVSPCLPLFEKLWSCTRRKKTKSAQGVHDVKRMDDGFSDTDWNESPYKLPESIVHGVPWFDENITSLTGHKRSTPINTSMISAPSHPQINKGTQMVMSAPTSLAPDTTDVRSGPATSQPPKFAVRPNISRPLQTTPQLTGHYFKSGGGSRGQPLAP